MIITRAPLRISLAGGGLDIPSWYERNGATFIAATINKYVYTLVHRRILEKLYIRYSQIEEVSHIEEIQNSLIREVYKEFKIESNVELTTSSDLPGRSGLGSSGAFLNSLILAISVFKAIKLTKKEIASLAADIEIYRLNEPVGVQDQFSSAIGGCNKFTIDRNGSVDSVQFNLGKGGLKSFKENLLLVFSGQTRDASEVLSSQKQRIEISEKKLMTKFEKNVEFALKFEHLLSVGDFDSYGALLDEYWENKKSMTENTSTYEIDEIYETALKNGALGGKVIGAGGGGFIIFYSCDVEKTKQAIIKRAWSVVDFDFQDSGVELLTTQ